MDVRNRCRGCGVSRRWRAALYGTSDLWSNLEVSKRSTLGGEKYMDVDEDGPGHFSAKVLAMLSPRVDDGGRLAVGGRRFSRVTRLDLSCTYVQLSVFGDAGVKAMVGDTLAHLILNGCPLVNSGSLCFLSNLPRLSSLELSHCDAIDDTGLDALSHFVPWVQHLNLSYLFRISEAGVKKLFRMSDLLSLNLIGCCRIKSYPWAVSNDHARATLPVKEISIGEDSRIQTRGFWLLWCTWQQWDMSKIVRICPFLETLRLNIVLFDLPSTGLEVLLSGCTHLKNLSLVVDRNLVSSICAASELLQNLKSLDLTIHIGVTSESFHLMVASNALKKLTALKFHSKHTNVFNDDSLKEMINQTKFLEFIELNCEEISANILISVSEKLKGLRALMMHHCQVSTKAMASLNTHFRALKELTLTDIQQIGHSNRLSMLVTSPQLTLSLKKLELSSSSGFCDKDLALVPKSCPNLQWVDFQFPFTYPRTTTNLGKFCPNLLYLRLSRISHAESLRSPTRLIRRGTVTAATATAPAPTPVATQVTGIPVAGIPATAATNIAPVAQPALPQSADITPQPAQPAVLAFPPVAAAAPVAATVTPTTVAAVAAAITVTTRNLPQAANTLTLPSTPPVPPQRVKFLNSSLESRALLEMGTNHCRRLRVLDVTGNLGLTDHVLKRLAALPRLHTVFLDGVEDITAKGVVAFAEDGWRSLKRLHIRGCKGCKLGVVNENYLTKALEVDLVIDGGRVLRSTNGMEEI
ncbi:hypothetical protein HK101_011174 [Irineochytrium annulatum]|nr:hypothetical protein HK101_011174 [Irineochytrium annulatum]